MLLAQVNSSDLQKANRMQENFIAYFRLFAGLPGITLVETDVTWFVAKARLATTSFGHKFLMRLRIAGSMKS